MNSHRRNRMFINLTKIIGTILINNLGEEDKWGRLVGFWLFVSNIFRLFRSMPKTTSRFET